MIHLLTSNLLPIRSIREYNDNFIFCHTRVERMVPVIQPKFRYIFDVYHQDEMVFDSDYSDNEDFSFHFIPVSTMTEALDLISDQLMKIEQSEKSKNEDIRDELTVSICCDYSWSKQVVKYLNSCFADHDSELTCLDLYQYMKIPSVEKMKEFVSSILNTKFVYPEDPISFGYALHQAINGRVR